MEKKYSSNHGTVSQQQLGQARRFHLNQAIWGTTRACRPLSRSRRRRRRKRKRKTIKHSSQTVSLSLCWSFLKAAPFPKCKLQVKKRLSRRSPKCHFHQITFWLKVAFTTACLKVIKILRRYGEVCIVQILKEILYGYYLLSFTPLKSFLKNYFISKLDWRLK